MIKMAIEFTCAKCGCRLRVGDEQAGREAKCPRCETVSTVPVPTAGVADPAPSGDPLDFLNAPDNAPGVYQSPPRAAGGFHRDIPTYLAQAILCTLFCCLPFGIVAIVYAAQVSGKVAAGDYRGAQVSSANARTWCWVSFLCGIIPTVLYVLAMMARVGGLR
jgi:phage FluMu protein Com